LTEEEQLAIDVRKVTEYIAMEDANNSPPRAAPEVVNLIDTDDDDEAGPRQSRVERHESTREYADRQRGARDAAHHRLEATPDELRAAREAARRVESSRIERELAARAGEERQEDESANAHDYGEEVRDAREDARCIARRQADESAQATGFGSR